MTKARILYKPDFGYFDVDMDSIAFAEAKGFETDIWRIKRRLWAHYGEGPLLVYKGSAKSLILHETIVPS
jgi:hypothetical protein